MKDKAPFLNSLQHENYEWARPLTFVLVAVNGSNLERDKFFSEQRQLDFVCLEISPTKILILRNRRILLSNNT
jgi:hypothetical protein